FSGGTQALNRRELWATKRVFFLTPQIMVNDLSRGTCPAVEIKCLVVDEAHKALGNHAYCQVVKELSRYTRQFRILALSATPGSDMKAVQQVISNLLIAQIQLCAEDSPEIQPYSHERQVEKIVVPLGEELVEIQDAYIQVLEAFAGRLIKMGVLARRDIPSLTKYQIILARDQHRKNPSPQNAGIQQGIVEGDFALCISLYHGYELLQQMGVRSLFIYLSGIMDGSKGLTRTKNELGRSEAFMKLYQQLRDMFSDTYQASVNGNLCKSRTVFGNKKEFIYSHPKLKKLEEIVVEHFKSWKTGCSDQTTSTSVGTVDTRVMIFSSFRDSVQEIAEMLSRFSPVVRVMTFVGHSTGKSTKGFTQKEQLEVVKRFREGGYNTLVSTCVGEEGLDIGEVDLIICFDAQKSPIRLVQRMGRTGRRRQGRIVVILAQGREERNYNQSQCNKRSIQKALSGNKMLHFYQHSPRMVPEGINPELHKMFITAEKYEPNDSRRLSRGRPGSLQHKSALFSCATGPQQIHGRESWSLSPEEFEIWDRLYRLKEGDGVKEPILPQIHFETIENLDETSRPEEEAAHTLSLSEWSIWQNRPFPTSAVDHSDRCHHFISVMEMIEAMREEQGDCSYELELQPHLRAEDVHVQRNKSHPSASKSALAQKAHSSRKDVARRAKPFLPDISDKESDFFSIFKTANVKTLKRTSGVGLEAPELHTDIDASGAHPARRLAAAEQAAPAGPVAEEMEKVTFDLNVFSDLGDSSESTVIHGSAATEELQTAARACSALGMGQAGLGFSSFTAEAAPVPPDLFYLPESYSDSFAFERSSAEPSWLEGAYSSVKRLLSRSPPPVNKLDDLEKMLESEGAACPLRPVVASSSSGQLQDKGCPASSEVDRSLLPSDSAELEVTSDWCASANACVSKAASPSQTAAGKAGERLHGAGSSNSPLGDEGFAEIQETTLTPGHALTDDPSNKHLLQEDKDLDMNTKNGITDEEKSIHLFEDEHIDDTDSEMLTESKEPPVTPGSGGNVARAAAEHGSERAPPEECCRDGGRTRREGPASSDGPAAAALGGGGTEWLLPSDGLSDSSQELFSVNFDLGFSFEEWEKEIFEEDGSAGNTPKFCGASGSHADVKFTGEKTEGLNESCRLQTLPKWDCHSLEKRNVSTSVPLQGSSVSHTAVTRGAAPAGEPGGRVGSDAPEASSPATPAGRRVRSVGAANRIHKVHASSLRKPFGSSALDARDSPAGGAEHLGDSEPRPRVSRLLRAEGASSESEEEIVFQRKNRKKKVLKSPDAARDSDPESPIHAVRKRRRLRAVVSRALVAWRETAANPFMQRIVTHLLHLLFSRNSRAARGVSSSGAAFRGRQFLDEEAELSQRDADCVSPDESDDTDGELNSSLGRFLNDAAEVTQALDDSEMRGVYLKSVRSPELGSRYKMVHREFSRVEIFSQIPEQDEAYAEDSFCVGEEEEEEACRKSESSEEEVSANFDLLADESFAGGRQQYLTRRRKRLNQAKRGEDRSVPVPKKRPSRIVVLSDSSGEEASVSHEPPAEADGCGAEQAEPPSASSAPRRKLTGEISARWPGGSRSQALLASKATVSELLDFLPGRAAGSASPCSGPVEEELQAPAEVEPAPGTAPPAAAAREAGAGLCVLVDSREISSGADVISSLRAVHGVRVQVCSLGSGDYVVSNRLAVERRLQSELLNSANRSKVTQRIQRLQSTFERVCVIVEKDRSKPGETSRFFQRTQYYDGLLAALLQAGVRILFSSCQEETASLLRDLALLEQRKNAAIRVPTEVEGRRQELLSFYLSIPHVSYPAALNMCHRFGSVRKLTNSSPSDIAAGAQVSPQRAEEIYRYLHYGFDVQLLPESLCAKGKSNAAARS
ncbi:FANCM protein, partial [Alectura lathami]|nr:FANCM protein [Alectura lathami]